MAAGLNGQGTVLSGLIQADRFIDYIFITAFKAAVHSAVIFNKFFQPGGGDGIGYNYSRFSFFKQNGRNQRDQAVAVDFLAFGIHSTCAVHIGIKNQADIGTALLYCRRDGSP